MCQHWESYSSVCCIRRFICDSVSETETQPSWTYQSFLFRINDGSFLMNEFIIKYGVERVEGVCWVGFFFTSVELAFLSAGLNNSRLLMESSWRNPLDGQSSQIWVGSHWWVHCLCESEKYLRLLKDAIKLCESLPWWHSYRDVSSKSEGS